MKSLTHSCRQNCIPSASKAVRVHCILKIRFVCTKLPRVRHIIDKKSFRRGMDQTYTRHFSSTKDLIKDRLFLISVRFSDYSQGYLKQNHFLSPKHSKSMKLCDYGQGREEDQIQNFKTAYLKIRLVVNNCRCFCSLNSEKNINLQLTLM